MRNGGNIRSGNKNNNDVSGGTYQSYQEDQEILRGLTSNVNNGVAQDDFDELSLDTIKEIDPNQETSRNNTGKNLPKYQIRQ